MVYKTYQEDVEAYKKTVFININKEHYFDFRVEIDKIEISECR